MILSVRLRFGPLRLVGFVPQSRAGNADYAARCIIGSDNTRAAVDVAVAGQQGSGGHARQPRRGE